MDVVRFLTIFFAVLPPVILAVLAIWLIYRGKEIPRRILPRYRMDGWSMTLSRLHPGLAPWLELSDDCPICLCPMLNTEIWILRNCHHVHHEICLFKWFNTQFSRFGSITCLTCPTCNDCGTLISYK